MKKTSMMHTVWGWIANRCRSSPRVPQRQVPIEHSVSQDDELFETVPI